MTACSDIINQAFESVGVIRPGETITGALQASAFLAMQQWWEAVTIDRVFSNAVYHQTFALSAGVSAYTVGTGGTLASTANPTAITAATSVSGNFRNACKVVSFEEFDTTVSDPLATSSVLAEVVAADQAWPSKNIRVFPTPAAAPGSLILEYTGQMTQFAAVTDVLAFAPGYANFLHWGLAELLYPRYARTGAMSLQAIQKNVADARNFIMSNHARILGLVPAPAAPAQG